MKETKELFKATQMQNEKILKDLVEISDTTLQNLSNMISL